VNDIDDDCEQKAELQLTSKGSSIYVSKYLTNDTYIYNTAQYNIMQLFLIITFNNYNYKTKSSSSSMILYSSIQYHQQQHQHHL
jgi:hypothetical protein